MARFFIVLQSLAAYLSNCANFDFLVENTYSLIFVNHGNQMTLNHKAEFGTEYQWEKTDTLTGCKTLLLLAVKELSVIEPFNLDPSNSGLERRELMLFKDKCIKILEEEIPVSAHKPKGIELALSFEVRALVRRLEHVERVNKVYSILNAVCGVIVGLLAAAPLGIPLLFSPVRNYIGSFFTSPKLSANQFQVHMDAAMNKLSEVLRHEMEIELSIDANNELIACVNNAGI